MSDNIGETIGGSVPLSNIQKVIGKRMLASKQQQPCFYLSTSADMTDLNKIRRKEGRKLKARLTTNDFFFAAMSRAVQEFPLMAGQLDGDHIQIAKAVNVGFAVAAPKGLLVPVIKAANEKTIVEISKDTENLTQKARSGKLAPDEMSGACISLSSLGMFGINDFIAIVPPSNTSILSIGKLVPTLVPDNGSYTVRKIMKMWLAVDHRIVNGDYAARFLQRVVHYLENPLELLPEKA